MYTYSLGSLADAARRTHKTDLVAAALPHLDVAGIRGTVLDWIAELGKETGSGWPVTVLSGVDSVEARHEVARLHADRTFDASTGGPIGTTLSLAEARFDGPCLRCFYPVLPPPAVSAEAQPAELTGLPLARIVRGDALTEADLAALNPAQRKRLVAHVNQPICGLARQLGLGFEPSFRPSAVFVAQQAAALAVGALIRSVTDPPTTRNDGERHVQFDALLGPRDGHTVLRRAAAGCPCQRGAALIRQVRQER